MKAPCMSKEQYKGIRDVVNDQGFAIHYTVISNMISHLEVFQYERINTAKDGLTSFLVLSVLEAKIIQYGFLEEHKVSVNNHYIDPQRKEMKSRLWRLNKNFWSPRRKC